MSDKTEALLQELVDLQKKDLREARQHRWLRFFFGTLPSFLLIILSIWAGLALLKETRDFLKSGPESVESYVESLIPSLQPIFGSDPRE